MHSLSVVVFATLAVSGIYAASFTEKEVSELLTLLQATEENDDIELAKRGNQDCSEYSVTYQKKPCVRYGFSFNEAVSFCERIGQKIATRAEIEEAVDQGLNQCACGWISDRTAVCPMTEARPGCFNRVGIHKCTWQGKWDVYCSPL